MKNDPELAAERMEKLLQARFSGRLVIIFLLFLLLAILLEYWVRPGIGDPRWENVVSTVAGSLVMAVILGFTFEVLLSDLRDRTFESLFARHFAHHRDVVFQRLDAFSLLSVGSLFDLLESIARQTTELPTLYPLPRTRESKEFTFADGVEYLENLVHSRPQETVEVLRRWIKPHSHPHVKFLASDFIGHFQLCDLKMELLTASRPKLLMIEEGLTDDGCLAPRGEGSTEISSDEAWALNYVWAASRCPDRPELLYQELGDLLCSTSSSRIQRWILFVPRQMPHPRFLDLIDAFLAQEKTIEEKVLFDTIETLAHLQRANVNTRRLTVRKIIETHRDRFADPRLEERIKEAWASLPVSSKPRLAGTVKVAVRERLAASKIARQLRRKASAQPASRSR